MPEADYAKKVAACAELWESGLWELHLTNQALTRVVFVFAAGRPSVAELKAVRAVLPQFRDAPARARGLNIRQEDASFTSYLPVKKDRSTVMLIEDDELARRVGEEMQRRGVHVFYAAAD